MGTKRKVTRLLVQARVKAGAKRKLTQLAAAGDRKLAAYIALVLEDHADQVSVESVRVITNAWRGVKVDRNSVVSAKDGPRK